MTTDIIKRAKGLEWRRGIILKLAAQGYRQQDIAELLQLDQSVISRDLKWVRKQAEQNMQHFISEEIPLEIDKAFLIFNWIMKECTVNYDKTDDKRVKMQILSLMKDVERDKLELLSNTTIAKEIVNRWKAKQEKLVASTEFVQSETKPDEDEEDEETPMMEAVESGDIPKDEEDLEPQE